MIELLDLGEGHIDYRDLVLPAGIHHRRYAVQGLRAENHIHVRGALAQGFAFLAGHAATHTDDQVRIVVLELLPAAELVKNLFLGLFAYGAGIEQDNVGFAFVLSQFELVRFAEQIRHACGVVLVHLAAMGLDEEFLRHKDMRVARPTRASP